MRKTITLAVPKDGTLEDVRQVYIDEGCGYRHDLETIEGMSQQIAERDRLLRRWLEWATTKVDDGDDLLVTTKRMLP